MPVRFLAGGESMELLRDEARGLASALRNLDGSQVGDGSVTLDPTVSLAAALVIEDAIAKDAPVDATPTEAGQICLALEMLTRLGGASPAMTHLLQAYSQEFDGNW
jgi:hypothetical protein